ncbi:hypothetical protein F5Y05DRAFT_121069 [Hypoxylon sp. FL0543]|nr:hypothetical protein F5Y05DRAFT_121069 [Hypoxylon sp. FL0543]
MCIIIYHAYELCPCQIRTSHVENCSCMLQDLTLFESEPCPFPRAQETGAHCHGSGKEIVQTGKPYCKWHARMNRLPEKVREKFFRDREPKKEPDSEDTTDSENRIAREETPVPEDTPMLGRRIGGAPLRPAGAANLETLPMPIEYYFLDDSSDDEPHPEHEKKWNYEHDVREWEELEDCLAHYDETKEKGLPYWKLGPRPRPPTSYPTPPDKLADYEWLWITYRFVEMMNQWRAALVAPDPSDLSEASASAWDLHWPPEWADEAPESSSTPASSRKKSSPSSNSSLDPASDAPNPTYGPDAEEIDLDRVAAYEMLKKTRRRSKRPTMWFKKRSRMSSPAAMKQAYTKFLRQHKWLRKWTARELGKCGKHVSFKYRRICYWASQPRRPKRLKRRYAVYAASPPARRPVVRVAPPLRSSSP